MPGTRYDIFLTVAAKGEVSTSEVQQITEITRDIQFNQDVQILFANNLIEKSGKTLKFPQNSENAQLLLDVLSFALMHDINYNNYITSPMMVFLEQTYNQNFFTFSSVQQPEETKTKMSAAHLGHTVSEVTRRKISNANTGHIMSQEQKRQLSESHKGKKMGKDNPNAKEVTQCNKQGVIMKVWPCISEASRELGISVSSISNSIKGLSKTFLT